jgi:hypothetical protein
VLFADDRSILLIGCCCFLFIQDSDPAKSYFGMTKFGLNFGEGFDLETSHLTELFGFTNVCVYWDYEPARQIVAMYFPLFEYSLAIYVFLDFINTMLTYKRGELPEWYWTLVKCVTPFNILLIAWFRMIFVFVAYNQPHFHSGAFLGMQIALFSVAVTNTWYVILTGQSYPTIGLSKGKTAILAHTYLICNVAVSAVKMYSTAYIVKNIHGPSYYLLPTPIPGMCLGQVIDLFWMIFNAIIPIFVSYTRRNNEDPLTIKFSIPTPIYDGDDGQTSETTSLVQPETPTVPVEDDITSGYHYIQSVSSKNYVNGRNSAPKNNQVYLSNDSTYVAYPKYFQWTFEKVGDMYMIKSLTSDKYLDGRNPQRIGQLGMVLVTAWTPGYNDMYLLWTVEKVDGNYFLKSKSSGAYLDGRNPEHTGAQILLTAGDRSPNGDRYLQWVIEPKP